MATRQIRLPGGVWDYDDRSPIGRAGGFGEIFLGRGAAGEVVAVKRLKITAAHAAHRELAIAEKLQQRPLLHVVPILDVGADAESDRYFLVMPLCEGCLQDVVDEAAGPINLKIAKEAITSIIAGLLEVDDIVHRDLKPSNVLRHEGNWKIADFGIAKFVEDSTSLETLRGCLTPAYAAPEQWQSVRPSKATDIYALGCILHALLRGTPPFAGSVDEVREHHLHSAPPMIDALPPRLSAFVSHMLRKAPDARPTLARCERVLGDLQTVDGGEGEGFSAIATAAKDVARHETDAEVASSAAAAKLAERDSLFDDAAAVLNHLTGRLFEGIRDSSESVKMGSPSKLRFGAASLEVVRGPTRLTPIIARRHARGNDPYTSSGWDVLGWAMIAVTCASGQGRKSYTWSATLLYANRADGDGFRWYEIAFWRLGSKTQDEPFGLEGYEPDIDLALGNVMHVVNVAYGPIPVDGEDEEGFIARWAGLVAKAATGDLGSPTRMPIESIV